MTDIEFCPKCNNIICECSTVSVEPIETDYVAEKFYDEILGSNIESVLIPNPTPEPDPTICEICDAKNPKMDWFKHCAMYMCPTCRDREMAATVKNAVFAEQRVAVMNKDMAERLSQEKQVETITKEIPIEGEIQVRSDIFNAQTISIIDMKKSIDEDTSIIKKHFELASQLKDKFLHLRKILFDVDEARVHISSEQRSIQTYLNELSNRLRDEEREKLKLADMSYQPAVSIPKTRKARKPTGPKFDKKEVIRLAKEINIKEWTLQTFCVRSNMTPVEAAKVLKGLQE